MLRTLLSHHLYFNMEQFRTCKWHGEGPAGQANNKCLKRV